MAFLGETFPQHLPVPGDGVVLPAVVVDVAVTVLFDFLASRSSRMPVGWRPLTGFVFHLLC